MKAFLDYKILEIGDYSMKLYNVFFLLLVIIVSIVIFAIIRNVIYRSKTLDVARKFSITKLTRYIIGTITLLFSLHIMKFNLSVLLAGSAALLVGLGFGLQNLFNDFISGIILLLDGTVKIGDIIEVNEMIYKVQKINFRTTIVIGRDEKYVILPNSGLTGNRVINWTHSEISSRFHIDIGVNYLSDVSLVMRLLKDTAIKNPKVISEPEPFVRFEDYGDSALLFSIYFYTKEIFRVENIKSEIRIEILKALHEHGINIPFPQRVVHIKNQ